MTAAAHVLGSRLQDFDAAGDYPGGFAAWRRENPGGTARAYADAWVRPEDRGWFLAGPPRHATGQSDTTGTVSPSTATSLRAGRDRQEPSKTAPTSSASTPGTGRLQLTPASSIRMRPVRWLWQGRLALGSLALIAGREGIGKSTFAYALAADLTRGRLDGVYAREHKGVIVAATEDSWEHTIVPRLVAAGADLGRVYRVDAVRREETGLVLPRDVSELAEHIRSNDVGLLLLDPLLSRLEAGLDTHKDADVRRALEPLVDLANTSGASVLGLIHVNKSNSGDPLTMVMGSRAFSAVARSVLFVMTDPEDESQRLLGVPKNNLGRTDLPTLTFRIDGVQVAESEEGPIHTGLLVWTGETSRSIRDALQEGGQDEDERTATGDAAAWLVDYLAQQGGTDASNSIKTAGRKAGHADTALKRARKGLGLIVETSGFPRTTFWTLPGTQSPVSASEATPGESDPTGPTGPTGQQSGHAQSENRW